MRQEENQACLGGGRNPWRPTRMGPGLRALGRRARRIIDAFITQHGEKVLRLYEGLGDETFKGTDEDLLAELRDAIAAEVGAVDRGKVLDEERGPRSEFRPGRCREYSRATGDPEGDLWDWLETGALLGISGPIPTSGIFPKVPPRTPDQG